MPSQDPRKVRNIHAVHHLFGSMPPTAEDVSRLHDATLKFHRRRLQKLSTRTGTRGDDEEMEQKRSEISRYARKANEMDNTTTRLTLPLPSNWTSGLYRCCI